MKVASRMKSNTRARTCAGTDWHCDCLLNGIRIPLRAHDLHSRCLVYVSFVKHYTARKCVLKMAGAKTSDPSVHYLHCVWRWSPTGLATRCDCTSTTTAVKRKRKKMQCAAPGSSACARISPITRRRQTTFSFNRACVHDDGR